MQPRTSVGQRGLRATLRIGLINNMPDAALQSTEAQFFGLLKGAAGSQPITVRLSSFPELPRSADKFVVDDWRQCCEGGTFYPLIRDGVLDRTHLHAEIGEIVNGVLAGRESDDERIVFWHRGFAVSDIVLGNYLLERANAKKLGRRLKLW